jgi:hypothetical protein
VCPVEHELYWNEDGKTIFEVRDQAQHKALDSFKNLTILNTNLVFGRDSYVSWFMTQCAEAGKINKTLGGSKQFQYKPVSTCDLANAV